jgi:hypothetical protein
MNMDAQLAAICLFTFTIHLIGTLAYAVRIAAVRTRKIALAFALFNVLVLVSRTCNSFQIPFLAKRLENAIQGAPAGGLLGDFRMIILCATLGSIAGALLIPTSQRIFTLAVYHFQRQRSIARLLFLGFSIQNLSGRVKETIKLPTLSNVRELQGLKRFDLKMIALNIIAVALLTVGIFSSLYAGFLNPEYRVTASSLSSVVNGVATLLMFIVIDPQLSVLTDDVMDGAVSEQTFRRVIIYLIGARVAGTVLAQFLFLPAAQITAMISSWF